MHSLGKALLAFDLLGFELQGQICLLFQVPCKVRTELEEWVEAAEREREQSESAIPQHPAEELEVSPLPCKALCLQLLSLMRQALFLLC